MTKGSEVKYTRKHLHQLGDGYYLRYVRIVNYITVCRIEDDIIYSVAHYQKKSSDGFSTELDDMAKEIHKSQVFKGVQDVYILDENEALLFLVDFY